MQKTLKYYEKNFNTLVQHYEQAKLKNIHTLLLKYTKKEDKILELGFGSGRELSFLQSQGYKNLYGIDGSLKFVEFVQKRFNNNKNFIHSILPKITLEGEFNCIYSIAVLMHLAPSSYKQLIDNINKKLTNNATLLFSFSLEKRKEQEREFYEVDEKLLKALLQEKGIILEEELITNDSLKRNLHWKTLIFRKQNEY